MKYEITHTCGHTSTKNITGTNVHGERDRKVAYHESTPCDTCYAEAKAAEQGCEAQEMHYGEYKKHYADCKTRPGSYDPETKTIIVYVPAETTDTDETDSPSNVPAAVQEQIDAAMANVPTPDENWTDQMKANLELNLQLIQRLYTMPANWWQGREDYTLKKLVNIMYSDQKEEQ